MQLTEQENKVISDLGFEVSQIMRQINQLELEKKAQATRLSDRIKELEAVLTEKCQTLEALTTYWVLDRPEPGKKTKYRKSTNEIIMVADMTSDDMPSLFDKADDPESYDLDDNEEDYGQTVDTMSLNELDAAENEQLLLPEAHGDEED